MINKYLRMKDVRPVKKVRGNMSLPNLKERLKGYIEKASIDLFGLEKMVDKNVKGYFQFLSQKHNAGPDELYVRIMPHTTTVKVLLYHNRTFIRELAVWELAAFFAGPHPLEGKGGEIKTVRSVLEFFRDYAEQRELGPDHLQAFISSCNDKTIVRLFNQDMYLGTVPMNKLIKYFKV